MKRINGLLLAVVMMFMSIPSARCEETPKFIKVCMNYDYCIALNDAGELWAWGNNSNGQFGNGTTEGSKVPIKVMDGIKDVDISSGYGRVAAVKEDGCVYEWGLAVSGEMHTEPVKVFDGAVSVSAGRYQTMAIKADGTLWIWGDSSGRFNKDGKIVSGKEPVQVMEDVIYCSAGANGNLAIKSDNTLWSWGTGEIGDGRRNGSREPVMIMEDVKQCCAGLYFSMAVKNDGTLWKWGDTSYVDGENIITWDNALPKQMREDIAQVNFSAAFVTLITKDGTLMSGNGHENMQLKSYIDNAVYASIGSAENGAAIDSDGSVWTWGETNHCGQLGTGAMATSREAVKIIENNKPLYEIPENILTLRNDAQTFDTSENHGMAVGEDGRLWVWGRNANGELGMPADEEWHEPFVLMEDVIGVNAGNGYSFAIKSDGTLWSWGTAEKNQLGVEEGKWEIKTTVTEPTKILDNIRYVDGKYHLAGAVTNDDKLYIWGTSCSHESTQYSSNVPELVTENAARVAFCEGSEAYVLKNDGKLYRCWGWSAYDFEKNYKVALENVVDCRLCGRHWVRALTADGLDYSDNSFTNGGDKVSAAIGAFASLDLDGNVVYSNQKILSGAADVGDNLAIKFDGSLWAFGDNKNGQLGVEPCEEITEPVKILDNIKIPENVDTPSKWAVQTVDSARELGLLFDIDFSYRKNITRAQFCKMAVNFMDLLGVEEDSEQNTEFSDTEEPYILRAAAAGVIKGYEDGSFRPSESITREHAAIMVKRLADMAGVEPNAEKSGFDDEFSKEGAAAVEFVSSCYDKVSEKKVMEGISEGKFGAAQSYTKEQSAAVFLRLYNIISK